MKTVSLAVVLAGTALFTGCQKKAAPAGAGGMPAFAVQVVVVEAQRQPVTESLSLVGTVTPNEVVEIKSETDGRVDEIPFWADWIDDRFIAMFRHLFVTQDVRARLVQLPAGERRLTNFLQSR